MKDQKPLLPGPLGELPRATQEKIHACVPASEIINGGYTARGMIAMMEGVKRYGPLPHRLIASATIPELIKAEKQSRKKKDGK